MNIAVFCSGNGTNFQAIADAARNKYFDASVSIMICDNKDARAMQRAKTENIKTLLVERDNFRTREDFENKIMAQLEKNNIELICLAGFMKIFSSDFIKKYKNMIINVHPSLLPAFKGAHGIKDAFEYGVKITGVTVHFVTEAVDSGPVILQQPLEIESSDTLESLEEKIHAIEHKLYPEAIRLYAEGRLEVNDKKVNIK